MCLLQMSSTVRSDIRLSVTSSHMLSSRLLRCSPSFMGFTERGTGQMHVRFHFDNVTRKMLIATAVVRLCRNVQSHSRAERLQFHAFTNAALAREI